jgi:mycothiol synthase
MTDDTILVPNAPAVPGLVFRHFRGESDYPAMASIINPSADADQMERTPTTAADLANTYTHLSNCDPYQDMIFAQINDQVIGYARGSWSCEENEGPFAYSLVRFLAPEWRGKGIGQVMLQWIEDRLRVIAAGHPPQRPRFFQAFNVHPGTDYAALLEAAGYTPARYFYDMVRPTLDDLPDFLLPTGLEVRPALPEHYRQIWNQATEDFRDHWNFTPPTEADYQAYLNDPNLFQPHLWQVAWDIAANQVAGQVRTYIDHAGNEKFNRKRGYTEFISVSRPWRRRGLARALIALSLRAQRDQGMTESALGVDTENLSGATRVYEDCGFRVVKKGAVYRKDL